MGYYRPIDQGVVATLDRTKKRIGVALDEYKNQGTSLHAVELNIRQSIMALKEVRKLILHGGYYG